MVAVDTAAEEEAAEAAVVLAAADIAADVDSRRVGGFPRPGRRLLDAGRRWICSFVVG